MSYPGGHAHDSREQRPIQAAESLGLETFEGAGTRRQYSSNPPLTTPVFFLAKHSKMADPIDSAL